MEVECPLPCSQQRTLNHKLSNLKPSLHVEEQLPRPCSMEQIIIIGGILVLFIYITRLASKEIFSPSNKIHREVGRAKDLSAPLYN